MARKTMLKKAMDKKHEFFSGLFSRTTEDLANC